MKTKKTNNKGGCIIINYNVQSNIEGDFCYEGRAQYVSYSDNSISNFFHFNTLVCKKGYNEFLDIIKNRLSSYLDGDVDFGYITIDDYNIKYTF